MITAIIVAGAAFMIWNICRFVFFIRSTHDVISANNARDIRWMRLALVLLIFFFGAYLFVDLLTAPHLITALILFFGSVFVAIVLTLLAHLMETAKKRSIDIAEVLVGVIDARDPNLNGHSRYVEEVTMLFYQYLPGHIKNVVNPVSLEYAALMHDVGKLGVPESILNKPAKLNEDEWKIMRKHPGTGTKILKPINNLASISPWIEYHHERPDGKGYYGLPDAEIPPAAKIIAIADTYCAITQRRSYKPPRTHEDAIDIIKGVEGTQLDRELAEIFVTIPKEKLIQCIPEEVRY